jgi:hypothetical protein
VATTFPTRYLPPVTYRDMPEPLPLRKVLGPGVIAAGIGLASGEFILWPYITSQVGLVFLWAAVLGVVTQFFINMEIERYPGHRRDRPDRVQPLLAPLGAVLALTMALVVYTMVERIEFFKVGIILFFIVVAMAPPSPPRPGAPCRTR